MFKSIKRCFIFAGIILLNSILMTACVPSPSMGSANNTPAAATQTQVVVFANEAAVAAYTYNFAQYRQNLDAASRYFTAEGWNAYRQALDNSGNLEAVIKKKLVVSAVATGAPVIIDQKYLNTRATWTVQMPILIRYQSAHQEARQHMIATLTIVNVSPTTRDTRGLKVISFIVNKVK